MKLILSKVKTSEFWYSNLFYIIAIIFVISFGIMNPKFATGENISNILAQSSVQIIISIGMALALITKGMDMSVGSILFICGVTMSVLGREYDFNMPQMMAVGLVIGVAAGLLNGFIVSSLNVYPLLPTLATMFAFRGVALVIGRGTGRNMPMFWNRIISARWGPLPIHVFVAFGLAIGVQLLLNNTKTGRHIYALGDSEKTSHEKGINARRIKILVYAVSGLMCAVASIIFTAQTMGLPPSSAVGIEFKCVTAAVLGGVSLFGGKGTVAPGVIIGSLLMSIISNVLVIMNASVYMYTIVYAVVILFVVLLETLKIRKLTSV